MHLTPSRCSWLADSHRSPFSFTSFLDAFPFRIRILLVIVWPVGSYIRWTQVRSFWWFSFPWYKGILGISVEQGIKKAVGLSAVPFLASTQELVSCIVVCARLQHDLSSCQS